MNFTRLTIQKKIFLFVVVINLALVSLMVFSNFMVKNQTMETLQSSRASTFNDIFWEEVNADAQALEKLLTVLVRNDDLVDTFMSANREALLAKAKPIFQALKSQFDITHFYFIDKDGRVFLRAHNPPKRGDQLKRATYLQARDSKKVGKGIEMGKKYFSLRVVMPIQRNGQLLGYLELGEELDHLIKNFKKVTNADVSMWVSEPYAQRKNLTKVFENIGSWYRVMSSNQTQQDGLMLEAASMIGADGHASFVRNLEGNDIDTSIFPFKDAFGDEAGVIMISSDVSVQEQNFNGFILKTLAVSLVFLLGLGFAAQRFSLSISRPLIAANAMLDDISSGNGDLTKRMTVTGSDEVAVMAEKFNLFADKLQQMIGEVAKSASEVSEISSHLSSASNDASHATQSQRSETDQVATAVNEMSSTIAEVARHATEAASAADEADNQSREGRSVVDQTISSIRELADKVDNSTDVISRLKAESENIGTVLDVIKGIAEQTNLLALNAAIEAARAGEQGRGFAVVADEVRTLAQRTQESTQEIEQMIESLQNGASDAEGVMVSSREYAQSTVEQAGKAGGALEAITRAVSTIREMNTQIATAAEEQSSVSEEINRNIVRIQQLAQDTDENIGRATEQSDNLSVRGQQLREFVSQFKY